MKNAILRVREHLGELATLQSQLTNNAKTISRTAKTIHDLYQLHSQEHGSKLQWTETITQVPREAIEKLRKVVQIILE